MQKPLKVTYVKNKMLYILYVHQILSFQTQWDLVSAHNDGIDEVRHGPGSTLLSQNVVLTQSQPLNLTLPITFP